MRRGRLLVLEGAEGVGKSTQLAALAAWLRERDIPGTVVREPGGTALGEAIRGLLLHSEGEIEARAEALLFMASRAQLLARVVGPALARGEVVIADRFFLSTYAYQIAGRGLPEGDVRAANAFAVAGLVPDLTILLQLPPGEGLSRMDSRGDRDRLEREGRAFHDRVERAFDAFATAAWQAAHPECGPIIAVDAGGAVVAVRDRIVAALAERWPETFAGSRAMR
jgi:dTMP kinase